MKKRILSLLVAAVVLPQGLVRGIPTNFNQGQFNVGMGNDNHVPMEEWFRSGSSWLAGAKLPGPWAADPADPSSLTLDSPGYVFGVFAAKGIVVKDNADAIREVRVVFDEKISGKKASDLIAALKKNIAAFTGAKAADAGHGSVTFTGAGLKVTLSSAGKSATVAMVPAPPKA
jgi:hypothetical protein